MGLTREQLLNIRAVNNQPDSDIKFDALLHDPSLMPLEQIQNLLSAHGGGAYSEQYQAVLDAGIGTAPSTERKAIENAALQIILDYPGLWDKVKLFVNYHTDGDSVFATINWKNVAAFQATIEAGTLFTELEGFRSDGDGYLNNVITIGDFDPTSVCLFSKNIDNAQQANSFLFGASAVGASSTSAIFINPRNTSDQMTYKVTGTQVVVTGITDATGRLCVGRDGEDVFHSINGAPKTSSGNASAITEGTLQIYSLAINSSAGPAGFNTRGAAYMVITDLLTDEEIAVMDSALELLTT